MRVDWCVLSWFCIIITHSLTHTLGSEDWCNPSHGGVFSDGRPSVHGELPLLRLPRLVPQARRVSPTSLTQDLARVGWGGLAAGKGCVRSRSPQSAPLLPVGPHERPRAPRRFVSRAWVRRAGHPPGRSTSDPKSGRYDARGLPPPLAQPLSFVCVEKSTIPYLVLVIDGSRTALPTRL